MKQWLVGKARIISAFEDAERRIRTIQSTILCRCCQVRGSFCDSEAEEALVRAAVVFSGPNIWLCSGELNSLFLN